MLEVLIMSAIVKIGIIGGSGLDDPDILENRVERSVSTPFGDPSDVIIEGEIKGVKCALLARHGRSHSISPTNVNYRANIWAFKLIGCTHVIVSTATGSLQEHIKPGDFVVPDSFIDRTFRREVTFFDGKKGSPSGVCHLPMHPAYCPRTRQILIDTTKQLGYDVHEKGTVVTIEGPRFSSKAESLMFRQWGGDLVSMTAVPEVVLAKEAGLLYGAVAMATDYDCWRDTGEAVNVTDVLAVFNKNVTKMKSILVQAVGNIAKEDWTDDINALRKIVGESNMLKS